MRKYEAMFILRPDLTEDTKKVLFNNINDVVTKNSGTVNQASLWSEKRKLYFPIRKFHEGIYYLVNFTVEPDAEAKIRHAYKLNEDILRVLIIVRE